MPDSGLSKKSLVVNGVGFFDNLMKGLAVFFADEDLHQTRFALQEKHRHSPLVEYDAIVEEYYEEARRHFEKHPEPFVKTLWQEIHSLPRNELENFVNHKQVRCKKWLLQGLKECWTDFDTVYVLGGWYGALGQMLLRDNDFQIGRVLSFDIDEVSTQTANRLNSFELREGRFLALTEDMITMNYGERRVQWPEGNELSELFVKPSLIINTSFEHIENYQEWLDQVPSGTRLVLQSNNYFAVPEHVNCVETIEAFEKQVGLSDVIWRSQLELKKYTRFMIIGTK